MIGIVGLFASLTIPAVQSSRESARRAQCLNHVRQLLQAVAAHEASLGYYPPDMSFDLMKFIGLVSRQAEVKTPLLACPSDAEARGELKNFGLSCRFNRGIDMLDQTKLCGFLPGSCGSEKLRSRDFKDGLSQTACLGERLAWPAAFATRPVFWDDFPEFWPRRLRRTSHPRETVDAFAQECQMAAQKPFTTWVDPGFVYDHVLPPNSPSCANGGLTQSGWSEEPVALPGFIWTSTSAHAGGAHIGMVDGSGRFWSNAVDLQIWRALGTRNGAELLESF